MTTTPNLMTIGMVADRPDETGMGRGARVEAQLAVAVAANQADALPDAAQVCLDAVCGLTGWPVGHLCLAAGDGGVDLLPTSVWHLEEPDRYRPFHRLSSLTCLTAGVGLPGQVLEGRRPVWIPDITECAAFPAAALAAELGLTSALGVPVVAAATWWRCWSSSQPTPRFPTPTCSSSWTTWLTSSVGSPSGTVRPKPCGSVRSASVGSWRRQATPS